MFWEQSCSDGQKIWLKYSNFIEKEKFEKIGDVESIIKWVFKQDISPIQGRDNSKIILHQRLGDFTMVILQPWYYYCNKICGNFLKKHDEARKKMGQILKKKVRENGLNYSLFYEEPVMKFRRNRFLLQFSEINSLIPLFVQFCIVDYLLLRPCKCAIKRYIPSNCLS